MKFWDTLENMLPLGESSSEATQLRGEIGGQTGDVRANTHLRLFKLYNREAAKRPILRRILQRLADRHLHEAQRSAQLMAEPLGIRAGLQYRHCELWDALENLETAIPKYRLWMKALKSVTDHERWLLSSFLAVGAETRSRLGQYPEAVEWFLESLTELHGMENPVRSDAAQLEDAILSEMVSCLLCEFKYEDAHNLIERALEGEMFSEYQSSMRQRLREQKRILGELVDRTRGFVFPQAGMKLWADLSEEVQRCETPEAAGRARRRILEKIEENDLSGQVERIGEAILALLEKELQPLLGVPPVLVPKTPPSVERKTPTSTRKMRPEDEKFMLAAARITEAQRKAAEQIAAFVRAVYENSVELNRTSAEEVKAIMLQAYHVPWRFRAIWLCEAALTVIVKFVAVEYLLGVVAHKFLESKGNSIAERLNFKSGELAITIAVAVVLAFVGDKAAKKIERMSLRGYKLLLLKLIADRMTALWMSYNRLQGIFSKWVRQADDLKQQRQARIGTSTA